MHDERQVLEVVPVVTAHVLPALDFRCMNFHQGAHVLHFRTVWMSLLARGKALLRVLQGLLRVPQPTENGQRIALG